MSEDKNYVVIKDSDGNEKSLYFKKETLSILDYWLRKEYPFMGELYGIELADLIKFAEYMTEKDNERESSADSECCCSESILEEAQRIVRGERQTDYADPVINFKRISDIASAVRGKDLDMLDCVTVQIATKLARQQNKHKRDNLVDLAGYAYIWYAIEECIANEKDKIEPPKGVPYCYTHTDKYRECKYYKHIEGLEGYCRLLKCEVLDQVKECCY